VGVEDSGIGPDHRGMGPGVLTIKAGKIGAILCLNQDILVPIDEGKEGSPIERQSGTLNRKGGRKAKTSKIAIRRRMATRFRKESKVFGIT